MRRANAKTVHGFIPHRIAAVRWFCLTSEIDQLLNARSGRNDLGVGLVIGLSGRSHVKGMEFRHWILVTFITFLESL
jgi:hypothetical protein